MSALRVVESMVLQAPIRVALGGVFCFAAWLKITDPQSFANAIKGFDLLPMDRDYLISFLAYMIPWAEMICGVLLVLGLRTRAAGLALGLQLVVFTVGIYSVIHREMNVACGCFGDAEWPCKGAIGWCHVGRNAGLLLASAYLAWRGGGILSLDEIIDRRSAAASGTDTDSDTASS